MSMFPKAEGIDFKNGWTIQLHFLAVLQTKLLDESGEFITCQDIETILLNAERMVDDTNKQKMGDKT